MFKAIRLKRKLKLSMSIIYSGEFGLDAIIKSITNSRSNQHKLVCAYVTIQKAALAKLNNEEQSIQSIIDETNKWENQLTDVESSQLVIELLKAQTEKLLLEAELKYNINKLAPEDSLEGIIFSAEKNKGGPLTKKELEEFTKLSQNLDKIEGKLEEHQSASQNVPAKSELKECLDELKDILSERNQERIRELESLRDKIRAELVEIEIISSDEKFFPPFAKWFSKQLKSDSTLTADEAVVTYTEKLEQFYKECIAAKELGLNPPRIED